MKYNIIVLLLFLNIAWSQKPYEKPNYQNLKNWAAHPLKQDPSDSLAGYCEFDEKDPMVDVFFVHPTSYTDKFDGTHWNASVDDAKVNYVTDQRSILYQASVFNSVAKVYAPRYRQAHLGVFFKPLNPNSKKALDMAYSDVKDAFEYYLKNLNGGRPIIIASHSQGTVHAIRLLQDFFDGKQLYQKLVCAYLVGYKVNKTDFKNIPFSNDSLSTGCFVTWRTHAYETVSVDVKLEKHNEILCTNPITWQNNIDCSNLSQHKGALDKDFDELLKNSLTACVSEKYNILWVKSNHKSFDFKMKNLHILDYQLFYEDIRHNARTRIGMFWKR